MLHIQDQLVTLLDSRLRWEQILWADEEWLTPVIWVPPLGVAPNAST
jgi:hypothetical protein